MNYEQAMEFLYSTSWLGSKLGLDRMHELMQRLGSPQNAIPCIHIAGTNGKGSVAAMLASVYTRAGYKTGLYTSPAISYFGERIQIDHEPIPKERIAALTGRMKECSDGMADAPTEYELITALSYLYFAEEKVDLAIIETGLGGLLDATNVLDAPVAAVITSIGLDHTRELGDTLEEIATQKAGIIKKQAPVIAYEQASEILDILRQHARQQEAPFYVASSLGFTEVEFSIDGTDFQDQNGIPYRIPLLGTHQIQNAAVVLKTLEVLQESFPVPIEAVQQGLAKTRWPGRFEVLQKDPVVIVDGAHNPHAARALKKNLQTYFPQRKIRFIVGILADKGYNSMVEEVLPLASRWITVTPGIDRGLPAEELAALLRARNQNVREADSLEEAIALSLKEMEPTEVLCIFGTLSIIHEVRTYFEK